MNSVFKKKYLYFVNPEDEPLWSKLRCLIPYLTFYFHHFYWNSHGTLYMYSTDSVHFILGENRLSRAPWPPLIFGENYKFVLACAGDGRLYLTSFHCLKKSKNDIVSIWLWLLIVRITKIVFRKFLLECIYFPIYSNTLIMLGANSGYGSV